MRVKEVGGGGGVLGRKKKGGNVVKLNVNKRYRIYIDRLNSKSQKKLTIHAFCEFFPYVL